VKVWDKLKALSRFERIALVLFFAVIANAILDYTTGYQLYGGDLLGLLFAIACIVLVVRWLRALFRKLLWRLRNRLVVSYVLFGVVPLALIVVMLTLGGLVLFGQIAATMVADDLVRRTDLTYSAAYDLALNTLYGMRAGSRTETPAEFIQGLRQRMPRLRAVIRSGNEVTTIPADAEIRDIPEWNAAGFKGTIEKDGFHAMAAHARAETADKAVDVLTFVPIDAELAGELARDIGSVGFFTGRVQSQNRNLRINDADTRAATVAPQTGSMPAARGFWDLPIGWLSLLPATSIEGKNRTLIMTIESRLSRVVPRLFTSMRNLGNALGVALLVVAGLFLLVEIVSLIISMGLTRSITRTVNDLYIGTRHVADADFAHRIPVRTKDQLSELATSFNNMTEHIQQLVLEVKEKEKLEAELEIAREVQAQLFPKGVPLLKTLELVGVCNPARTVSGDYYDFVPVDGRWTAIVIGDIAGKGISAALLMASVQSALHAQIAALGYGVPSVNPAAAPSTATLVARLNRQLYANTSSAKYATFYCAVYDDDSGQLSYTNAGHLPPILVRDGKASRLEVNGMVVGVFPEAAYDQVALELQPGDLLAAFTDGVTESENAQQEQFGDERLAGLLIENSQRPLEEIVEIVMRSVREWAYDLENQDDTTMLLARRL
jgi:phosphoserine phosphatase RsbU/P